MYTARLTQNQTPALIQWNMPFLKLLPKTLYRSRAGSHFLCLEQNMIFGRFWLLVIKKSQKIEWIQNIESTFELLLLSLHIKHFLLPLALLVHVTYTIVSCSLYYDFDCFCCQALNKSQIMAVPVVEFSREVYKIRYVFA